MIASQKRRITYLTLLCSVLYFASYLTRYNFGAVLVEIAARESISKALASMSVTGLFITYGLGQLISGFIGDKFAPEKIIFAGLFTSALMNIIISQVTNPYLMLVIWCINGFAQSMIWPPLVRIMATQFDSNGYKRVSFFVSCGSSVGTIAVYLIAPLIITLASWQAVFIFCGLVAMIMSLIWILSYGKLKTNDIVETVVQENKKSFYFIKELGKGGSILFIFVLVAILCQGALRDGITTWMPTLMNEAFSLTTTVSILSGVALPIFAIISYRIAMRVNKSLVNNDISSAGIMFLVGFVCLILMATFGIRDKFLSVILLMLTTGAMHGVNLMLISMLPSKFKKFGNVSFISGILNTCTYVGSALSSYGIALFTDSFGWNTTVILWAVISLIGLASCIVSKRLYNILES